MPDDTTLATPGQAAYEAHAAMVVPRPWRWDQLDDKLRDAWDAAAEAANRAGLAKVLAECARYKAERDAARSQAANVTIVMRQAQHVLEEHDEPDDDARGRALAIICAALEAAP